MPKWSKVVIKLFIFQGSQENNIFHQNITKKLITLYVYNATPPPNPQPSDLAIDCALKLGLFHTFYIVGGGHETLMADL